MNKQLTQSDEIYLNVFFTFHSSDACAGILRSSIRNIPIVRAPTFELSKYFFSVFSYDQRIQNAHFV